jgi:TonB family protein
MSETSRAPDDTPSSIGRYEVTRILGFGAMGAVYQAFDPIIKRSLAIKTIRLDVPRKSPQHVAFIERFYQEARISGTLSHPNIVTLFDVGEEKGVPFLAMEYVEGQTLSEMLEKGVRFEPRRVVTLVSQMASALDYAHSRGVIHRDIKPSNLIVEEGDRLKITDFGIAKLADQEITQTGALLGTPSYMSPEQAMGEPLDGRSDIFSLGVCAFEMLSGEQPFPGNNVTSILYRLVHVDPVEPANLEMSGVVPHRWRQVFHKVLAKKREGRYQKATDFVRALEECLGAVSEGVGEETIALATPDEPTVTLETPLPESPAQSTGAIPSDSTPEEETLVLESSSETGMEGPDDSVTTRVPAGAEDTTAADVTVEAQGPTAILETVPRESAPAPTELMGPGPAEGPAGPTAILDTAAAATLPPERSATAPRGAPAPVRRPLPAGWLLGGAAGLFVVAAGLVVWMLSSRVGEQSQPVEVPPTAAPIADTAAPPTTGTLRVESEPAGARVTVDGEARGETPLELGEVSFGRHEVGLALKGYVAQSHDVTLSAEDPSSDVRAELVRPRPTSGTVSFVSVPAGATVFVDGRKVGTTPLDGLRLPPGPHDVSLTLDGHDRWSGSVDVVAGRRARLEKELVPAAPAPPPTPEPVDTARVYENKVGQVDRPARKKSGLSPSYPSDRAPRLQKGERVSVTLTFLVTETGAVEDVEVVESAGSVIDEVVTTAVRSWEYEPATIRGTPVKVRVRFRQTFLGG